MTAIVLGATGLTGRHLMDFLLADGSFKNIKVFTRRPLGIDHPKIKEFLIDLLELDKSKSDFTGDVVFCCIGTTKKKTPDKALYKKIDHGIPVSAAKLAKENKIPAFLVISALGADENSRFFYNRTKGSMERDIKALGIPNTYILKPSLIVGDRNEKRFGESVASRLFGTFDSLIPKKYKKIQARTIAKAMHNLAQYNDFHTEITSDEIKRIAALTP